MAQVTRAANIAKENKNLEYWAEAIKMKFNTPSICFSSTII
jgi:hypothetical protein